MPLRRNRQILSAILAVSAGLNLAAQNESALDRYSSAATSAMRAGNYAAAEKSYRLVVGLRPAMAEAYVNLGLSCFLQRKYVEAIASLEAGQRLRPDLANAKLFLGISHFKLNHPEPALTNLSQYVITRPGDKEGQYYLGLTYLSLKRYSDAETALIAARSLEPGNIDILYHLTQSYLGQAAEEPLKRNSLALRYHDAVEEIAAIDPGSYRLAQLRAGFYEAEGKKGEAIQELESLLRQNPKSRGLHYTLGCLYTEAREYPKALSEFEAELTVDSPYPRTYLQLGHVYVALEKPDKAIPILKKALTIEPESSGLAWIEIGRAYRLQGHANLAVTAFEQAIVHGEVKASVFYQLSIAAKKSGDEKRSREALEASQRLRREEQSTSLAGDR